MPYIHPSKQPQDQRLPAHDKAAATRQICCMPNFPTSGHSHLRLGRRSISGQLYLLTTVTAKRQRLFTDTELARITARTLASENIWLPGRCPCWVLMPDHFHALVELGEGASLSKAMQRVKGVSARVVNKYRAHQGPLWAKGFHDHALRKDEAIEDCRRIHHRQSGARRPRAQPDGLSVLGRMVR